ncbi:MAG: DUF3276 family protein [Bacteroidales bacterium]
MEEGNEKMEGIERINREEIFSKAVRAGKRTYFFDVKATRKNDYYLTVTESKKRLNKEGRQFYEKHKIFLYSEDFDKFMQGLADAVDFIKTAQPEPLHTESVREEELEVADEYTNVDFDDLEMNK